MVSVTALQLVLKRVSEAPQIHNLIRSHPAVIRAARASLVRLAYRHLSSKADEHRESYTWMDPPMKSPDLPIVSRIGRSL
jgi:hypothetical protein